MTAHADQRDLPYSAQQMYDLVADVASYPQFLPWCAGARIRSHRQQDGIGVMEADLIISFKVFRERFGSRVTLDRPNMQILTEYIDGPFKFLHSRWHFADRPTGGCTVSFSVDFEFKNRVLQALIGVVFDEAMRRIVRAFEDRARALYG